VRNNHPPLLLHHHLRVFSFSYLSNDVFFSQVMIVF
jgi:hypothetical protein